jgi:hypothetical protein
MMDVDADRVLCTNSSTTKQTNQTNQINESIKRSFSTLSNTSTIIEETYLESTTEKKNKKIKSTKKSTQMKQTTIVPLQSQSTSTDQPKKRGRPSMQRLQTQREEQEQLDPSAYPPKQLATQAALDFTRQLEQDSKLQHEHSRRLARQQRERDPIVQQKRIERMRGLRAQQPTVCTNNSNEQLGK